MLFNNNLETTTNVIIIQIIWDEKALFQENYVIFKLGIASLPILIEIISWGYSFHAKLKALITL